MRDACKPFEGKRITMLGLGLLGRGAGDAEFLAKCGADVLVTDKKNESELAESVEKLRRYPNVSFRLGGHKVDDFSSRGGSAFGGHRPDLIIKAAGVRLDSPEVATACAAGIPVAMSTALFAKYAMAEGVKIIGITGTRGKSTVAHLIHYVLIRANKHIVLGGNIRGISTLAMLPEVEAGDIAVLELDSWQLQGFGGMRMSPHITVFTNLMPDHLNYYKNMGEYFADKANIFRYQISGDSLFVGASVLERVQAARPPAAPLVPPAIPSGWKLKIPGEHNRENASFAAAALRALGIGDSEIRSGIESFEGVEGRLQFVGETRGVKIYNDNNATTPEATIAGLRALNIPGKRIILIMGGSDKGLDMDPLVKEISASCKQVLLLAGTGTARIEKDLRTAPVCENLESAFNSAMKDAVDGDIILFSPAFASFGMFKNEYERNDQFVKLVKKYL